MKYVSILSLMTFFINCFDSIFSIRIVIKMKCFFATSKFDIIVVSIYFDFQKLYLKYVQRSISKQINNQKRFFEETICVVDIRYFELHKINVINFQAMIINCYCITIQSFETTKIEFLRINMIYQINFRLCIEYCSRFVSSLILALYVNLDLDALTNHEFFELLASSSRFVSMIFAHI